jgi:hypothetical protein
MADDKIKVIIAFDPADRTREGKTEELSAAEAHNLVSTGRARYADAEPGKGKSGGGGGNGNGGGGNGGGAQATSQS